ncbi:MAG: hypothetical protein O2954_09795 [bacterium]|nr:hypothetical protein [bacterium]
MKQNPDALPLGAQRICFFLFCLILFPTAGFAQYEPDTAQAFSIRSPYSARAKTRQVLNTLGTRILLFLNYTEQDAQAGAWKTRDMSGMEEARYFTRAVDTATYRTIEIALMPHPEGGYEFYVYGQEIRSDGAQWANPDLAYIQSEFANQITAIQTEQQNVSLEDMGHQIYHLSYLQSDRALALLKSLGYTTVEFTQQAGESVNDRIYAPIQNGQWNLPVVVKLIDSAKTSLMDPAPVSQFGQQQGYAQTYSAVPDIGGTFLHQMTSGEPQQRLLLVYNKNNPEPMEALLSLLRDKIDRPSRQIVIEALVIEINTDKLKELGINFDGGKDDFRASFAEQGQNSPFSFIFDRNSFGKNFFFQGGLKAMMSSGDAEILSSPSVLVLDGRQARIQVGQHQLARKSTSTASGIIQSVDYFPVGIVLNLRPRINEDGTEITMQVETIVSAVNQSGSTQAGEVFFAPTVDNRQVQTFVRVADNTPFIIGGLISTDKQERTVGIPILSQIPILGIPFRRKITDSTKKEVIVVLTPHVIPLEEKSFSYVIPKDSKIFDAFGNQLFRNAYRIRDDDVFDLRFLYDSEVFQNLTSSLQAHTIDNPGLKTQEPYASILNGHVPGEDILVRRMLWELVLKTNFARHISPDRMILLEDRPDAPDSSGFQIAFLGKLLARREKEGANTLKLTFDTRGRGTLEHPFVPPKTRLTFENIELTPEGYTTALIEGNRRRADGKPNQWTTLLADIKPSGARNATTLEVLQAVMALKRILALNTTFPLTIDEFRVGRQIIFPTEQDLQQRYHIIDRDAAQFFYEVIQYYPEFEGAFSRETRRILHQMQASGMSSPTGGQ